MINDPKIRISVSPAPTDEEAAAIAAAVLAVASRPGEGKPVKPAIDRWREAGKTEALHTAAWPIGVSRWNDG